MQVYWREHSAMWYMRTKFAKCVCRELQKKKKSSLRENFIQHSIFNIYRYIYIYIYKWNLPTQESKYLLPQCKMPFSKFSFAFNSA